MRFLFPQFPALGLALVSLSAAAQNPRAKPFLPAISNLHQLTRNSGYIFDGTVLSVEQSAQDETDSVATVQVTFRVEQAIRGTRAGQVLTIREWAGLWNSGERYHSGNGFCCFSTVPASWASPARWAARQAASPWIVSRPTPAPPPVSIGGIIIGKNPPPVIVSSSQITVLSDPLGLATLQPSTGAAQGALVIQGTAAAGTSLLPFQLQSLLPVAPPASSGSSRPQQDAPLRNDQNSPENFPRDLRVRQPRQPQS